MVNSARLLVLLITLLSLPAMAAKDDQPPFFKLEYQGKTAWLLGSVHVGAADFYPMPSVIEKAFNQADALVVEADIDEADVFPLVRRYGLSQQPLAAARQAAFSQYCTDKQTLCQSIAGLAPWMQAMQITMTHFMAAGLTPDYGVDTHFLSRRDDKPVYQLESIEQQFALLASFNADLQWLMLEQAMQEQPGDASELVQVWRQGDHQALIKIMEGDLSQPEQKLFIERLLWQRNHNMTATTISLLENTNIPGPLFIIIGAGHLVGQDNIPQLLQDKGVKVSQLLPLQ